MINLQLNYPSVSEEAGILEDFLREFSEYRGSVAFPDYQGEKHNVDLAFRWPMVQKGTPP